MICCVREFVSTSGNGTDTDTVISISARNIHDTVTVLSKNSHGSNPGSKIVPLGYTCLSSFSLFAVAVVGLSDGYVFLLI